MGILYILLSIREVKNMHSFLGGDHWIIRMSEETRISFKTIKETNFQTLQERGISRDYWKWILKSLIIFITQMRASSC
jgi:hypothetical protein